jgi:hypothetical protein
MDALYHPHFGHDSKPTGKYFFEFLLIFFAVSLGFFAESLREGYVDRLKAKEFAQSLYDDLKVDTVLIQKTYKEKAWIVTKYDSAENILASADLYKNNEFIYYAESYLAYNDEFLSQNATWQQLQNLGSFHYIKNINLYKKIAGYYNLFKRYESVDGQLSYSQRRNDLIAIEAKLFNLRDLKSLNNYNTTDFYNLTKRPASELKPIRRDAEYLKMLYLNFDNSKQRAKSTMAFLGSLKVKATEIMRDLKKEYKLK